jgi:iron complex transport system ATP-binding protein
MSARLALVDVSAGYGERVALRDFSLEVAVGEMIALVGPNGAGKSTALKVAAGLIKPSTGQVLLDGRDVASWSRRELARQLTVVLQLNTTPPLMKVRDYVALGRTPFVPFLGNESLYDRQAVQQAISVAGAGELADRRIDELSGGERQRVVIARALAQEPSVLLLDEPTSNLDLKYQDVVLSLARRLCREQGLACLVVLHDITLASQFCDRVCLIDRARAVAAGTPAEVLQPEMLSSVYETPLEVLHHPMSHRPVIVHAGPRTEPDR